MSQTDSSRRVDTFKKKIFEIGAEMTEKIEIKVLAPILHVLKENINL